MVGGTADVECDARPSDTGLRLWLRAAHAKCASAERVKVELQSRRSVRLADATHVRPR